MRIKIFQMESSERTYGKKFFGIPKDGVDPSLYKNVYYGDVDADNLEDVYRLFNDDRPYTFQGHSLSMSDVVQVCNENEDLVTPNGSYFVKDIGFEKIDFDASKAQEQEGMRVVYVTPNNTPLDIRIGTELRDLQNAVGGLIQPIYNDDGTVIVGNDDAKLIGMKGNRHLNYGGIIAGPFFVCGEEGEEFRSLTDEEAEKYILHYLMENPVQGKSIEYNDNRLALYCAQQGKCAITNKPLMIGDIHCHHKTRRADGGDDKYSNLVLIKQDVHILLHAVHLETISCYLQKLSLDSKQRDKLNRLRKRLNLNPI